MNRGSNFFRYVEVERLGQIAQGKVEVKPLTIFCGPNNTGKTYFMYGLYGIMDDFPRGLPFPGLDSVAAALADAGEIDWDLDDWLDKNWKGVLRNLQEGLRFRLEGTFNSKDSLFRDSFISGRFEKEGMREQVLASEIDYRLVMGREEFDALRIVKQKGERVAHITLLAKRLPDLKARIVEGIVSVLLGYKESRKTFLIPAERNGLHLFYKELSNRRTALLHHAFKEELDIGKLLKDVLTSKYAAPIADYIDWLNQLASAKKAGKGPYHKYAEEIKGLVGGKYEVDSSGDIYFAARKERNKLAIPRFEIHLGSSTVKSLFGLWFFLEYQAREGDVIMIDEPELNLHPDNQRRLAKTLSKLANAGIYVILSTHSDYLVKEVNSLIMLSSSNSVNLELMKKYGYCSESVIRPDNVAAYLFDKGTITAMEVNQRDGIIAETFDKTINALNTASDDIYYSNLECDQEISDLL